MRQKIWLITDVANSFGGAMVEQLINAGDFVIGALREASQIKAFNSFYDGKAVAISLDLTNSAAIEEAVSSLIDQYEHIDVLVNNAGSGLFGAVEEISQQDIRHHMEVNFFGVLTLTQAVLPHMRKRRQGHIVQVCASNSFKGKAGLGLYNASKYALEGFSEALEKEVAPLGIKVLIVEPGTFHIHQEDHTIPVTQTQIKEYAQTAHKVIRALKDTPVGEPEKAAEMLIKVINFRPILRIESHHPELKMVS